MTSLLQETFYFHRETYRVNNMRCDGKGDEPCDWKEVSPATRKR